MASGSSQSILQQQAWTQKLHRMRFLLVIPYIAAIVVAGFNPYFVSLTHFAIPDVHWLIHIHAVIYVGWLILLFEQARRIYKKDMKGHLKLGEAGIKYGFAVLALGIIVAFAGPVIRFQNHDMTLDQAAGFLIFTIGDMILFGTLFFAAIKFRRQPHLHKRFMLMAAVALAFAACARLMPATETPGQFLLLWFSPLILTMAFDTIKSVRHHSIYLGGMAFMALMYGRVFFKGSELWLPIGRGIIRFFTAT